ncbi:MAG: hypothetical protein PHF63_00185 [Herbinix sp.]|nr:hypothetical protein [Herbinix sp.]
MAKTLSECSTIGDCVDFGKNLDISLSSLAYKGAFTDDSGNKIIYNTTNIIGRYDSLLAEYVEDMEYTEAEFVKYYMQPKRLSLDLYKTTELWALLLRLNKMTDITQFTKSKIKIYNKEILGVINEILILEDVSITKNKKESGII